MNVAESERMAGQLQKIGYTLTEDFETADLILFNTCCVRATAEDKIYGKIGEIKKALLAHCAVRPQDNTKEKLLEIARDCI